jgi:hypothetical protein
MGRGFERGLRPLSLILPSPANNDPGFLHTYGLERGQGVRSATSNNYRIAAAETTSLAFAASFGIK